MVVGLDPSPALLPAEISSRSQSEPEAVLEFCIGILEAVESEVAAVKLQSAYFERLGPPGMEVYTAVIGAASCLGLPVIADVKRGDIRPVSAAYAEAHLSVYGATCVTVNPYMGEDAIEPFLGEARRIGRGGGVFVLIATSNPSAGTLQWLGQPPVSEVVAQLVKRLGCEGESGYTDAGAVVGVTRPEAGKRVRELLPKTLFLSPGYGAQGGDAAAVRPLLDASGGGVLVNSSRGIIGAYADSESVDYKSAARGAARRMREELKAAGVGV